MCDGEREKHRVVEDSMRLLIKIDIEREREREVERSLKQKEFKIIVSRIRWFNC